MLRFELPELDDEEMIETYSDYASSIAETTAAHIADSLHLPPLNINEPYNPFNSLDPSKIDLNQLHKLRFLHQTKQPKTVVRKSKNQQLPSQETLATSKPLTERKKLLQRTVDILKERGEKSIGTGVERLIRWTSRQATASSWG